MIHDNNLAFLSKKVIDKITSTVQKVINYKTSKDNNVIPIVNNTTLHSIYYPLKESERLNFIKTNNTLCIGIGFGAGYHLINYCNLQKEIIVIAVEYDMLGSILENIDLSTLFPKNILRIIDQSEIVDYFDFYKYDDYFLIIHPVLQNIYSKEILATTQEIKNKLNPIIFDIKTQKKFGLIWQNNINKNLIDFFKKAFDFTPLTIDKPILICGAGPSLDMNINEIYNNREQIYIASTDTALKILERNKIYPDSVFSFDCQNYSFLHFIETKKEYRLFTDFTSPLRNINIKHTPLFSNHPFFKIFEYLDYPVVKLPSISGNIGGAISDFFRFYFKDLPIITVGIDYGYYKNLSYSNGSYLSDYKLQNEGYYNTSENIDAKLFYKTNFIKIENEWKTTSLLSEYNKLTNHDLYTLSESPFVEFKRIKSIKDIVKKDIRATTIHFVKPKLSIDNFINVIEKNKSDLKLFIPFFLHKRKLPDNKTIDELIEKIRKMVLPKKSKLNT